MRRLADRVAVVTGAGSGIGRAVALELARRGCHVAITDLDVERLLPVQQEIEALGRRCSRHGFDVSAREAWPGFVQQLQSEYPRVHLVINNAGVSLLGRFLACSLDDIDWQLRVNQNGVIHGCHFLLPLLLEAGRADGEAHLVNLSSIFGIVSVPSNAAYCMSKHAVRALTEALELELWDEPITVTSVHPGAIATRIAEDGRHLEGGAFTRVWARKAIARGMAPHDAAQVIVDGIQRDHRRILVGNDARWFATLQQAMPVRYRNLVHRWLKRMGPSKRS